jgi:anti-sigma regulatory factor (Ser/Thr protein kinase)
MQSAEMINLGDRPATASEFRPPVMSESYPAVAGSVSLARRAMTEFALAAGASQKQVEAVRLAVSEAITNAVLHAYGSRPGRVQLTACLVSRGLWVLVSDDGSGLRASSDRPGLGLGLGLIRQLSDHFTIVPRAGGGTELRLCFTVET